jgi:hypothetical protein
MSKLCSLSRTSLAQLRGMYLVHHQRGVFRKQREDDPQSSVQGLHFNCPTCKEHHGITILFHGVPECVAPTGARYGFNRTEDAEMPLPKMHDLTIIQKIKSPYCMWQGYVTKGEVFWKAQR